MGITIKVISKKRYESLAEKVDIEALIFEEGEFSGGICIYTKDGDLTPFYGFIETDDFEKEYGFVLAVTQDSG